MSTIVGPWILNGQQSQSLLEAIVNKLDKTLYGKRVVLVKHDSVYETLGNQMISSYTDIARHCELRDRVIFIPAGLGIYMRLHPLLWHGRKLPTSFDVNGDHVTISIPYLFFEDEHRVDYRDYTITAFRPSS